MSEINPKCSKCKCYFIQDEFKSSGLPYSTCKKCRDSGKNRNKKYREQNEDKIKDSKKEYIEKNKDKIKQYREQNKDKMKQYNKEYYEQNENKIKKEKQRIHST